MKSSRSLFISLESCLETLAVFLQLTLLLYMIPCGIFILFYYWFLRFSLTFNILLLTYLVWYVWDFQTPFRGGRKWKFFRDSMGRYYSNYFPIKIVPTGPIPANRKYLFACFPHGIWAFSQFATFGTNGTGFQEKFPGLNITMITVRALFFVPIIREYFLLMGACPASHESIDYILEHSLPGSGAAIVVGGVREIYTTRPKTMILVLKDRKGFVKKALRYGASLVPVISFGENDLYDVYPKNPSESYRNWQDSIYEKTKFLLPLHNGRGLFQSSFGLMPHRKPIHVVVGEPIDPVPLNGREPTKQDIDELHQKYIEALTDLYEKHRDQYGYKDVPLQLK